MMLIVIVAFRVSQAVVQGSPAFAAFDQGLGSDREICDLGEDIWLSFLQLQRKERAVRVRSETELTPWGAECSSDAECKSVWDSEDQFCVGGRCCGATADAENCAACNDAGHCQACMDGFEWVPNVDVAVVPRRT